MKLKELLTTIDDNDCIRIFSGCMTIFNGIMSNADVKEWNLKVRPHLDCKVLSTCAINGTIVIII